MNCVNIYIYIFLNETKKEKKDFFFSPESRPGQQDHRLPLSAQVCTVLNMIALKVAMVTLIFLLYNVQRIASHQ